MTSYKVARILDKYFIPDLSDLILGYLKEEVYVVKDEVAWNIFSHTLFKHKQDAFDAVMSTIEKNHPNARPNVLKWARKRLRKTGRIDRSNGLPNMRSLRIKKWNVN